MTDGGITPDPRAQPIAAFQTPTPDGPARPLPGKPRHRGFTPDIGAYRWLIGGSLGLLVLLIAFAAVFLLPRDADNDQQQRRLEASGLPVEATVVDSSDPLVGPNQYTVEYVIGDETTTGTITTWSRLGSNPSILLDRYDVDLIGVRGGVQGGTFNTLLALWAWVFVIVLIAYPCILAFAIVRRLRMRWPRQRKTTKDPDLPQVFEGRITARRADLFGSWTFKERYAEVTVTDQGIVIRSLRWRLEPIEIPGSSIHRINLGRRDGLSGGGEIYADGWYELKIAPTARARYRDALQTAGLVLHHCPWQPDLVEATPLGHDPSWGQSTAPSTTGPDDQGPHATDR